MRDEVRVVVVDDVGDEAEALALALSLDGYEVRTAHDGLAALDLVAEFSPHCVLLDIDMPGLNGCELSRRLRDRHGDDLVLIAVSGWGHEDLRLSKDFECIDHYLRKPFDAERLKRLLPPVEG